MRVLDFSPLHDRVAAALARPNVAAVRSIFDAIASRNAPIAPGGDADGFFLADLDSHACRFPTRRDDRGTRFCAVAVEVEAWQPGTVNGCYCAFHRDFLARQPRVTADDGEGA